MSRASPDWKPKKSKSEQRDDRRKARKLEAESFEDLTKRLGTLSKLQQMHEELRADKYSCLGVTESDLGSPGHTPQKYRDAYQDFTDLYGHLFDDENSIAGTNEDEYEKHTEDTDEDMEDDCKLMPRYARKNRPDDDNESIASDSTTASEKYNMYNISESVLRMATGFPGWVPDYGNKKAREYGSNSSVSSVSPPADREMKEFGSVSVSSSPQASVEGMECESDLLSESVESVSPPAHLGGMDTDSDSDSVGSVSSPTEVKEMEVDSDSNESESILPSIEFDYETERPAVQQAKDSDETLSDSNNEEDSDGSMSITSTSYDSPRRTNKPVNHQFFYLHHRMVKRDAPFYAVNGNTKRPKVSRVPSHFSSTFS
ncbi:uncharacterized protein GIQ15_05551 [Arthroderma uncinatum]|uniref:uncharacterized protein n=1 Tax=Arthroderma uncinatum TaxID=74035 RepID=UPI00144A4F48|nr:uncharacterized protein GIQ15_05551 [Arthroderma uncinatum]KAF3480204.1 hypothetical protein GIQ15_05551 [Arthroderma uncinatum]